MKDPEVFALGLRGRTPPPLGQARPRMLPHCLRHGTQLPGLLWLCLSTAQQASGLLGTISERLRRTDWSSATSPSRWVSPPSPPASDHHAAWRWQRTANSLRPSSNCLACRCEPCQTASLAAVLLTTASILILRTPTRRKWLHRTHLWRLDECVSQAKQI